MKKILLLVLLIVILCLVSACRENSPETSSTPDTVVGTHTENKEVSYMSNGLEYVIDSDIACHITGIGTFTGEALTIPRDDGNGHLVTYIDDYAFMGNTSIKKVSIPDTVKEINGGAFQSCTSLEEIIFSEGLEKIEVWAFYGCISLTQVTIPATVDVIGQGSFSLCSGITSFTVAGENENYKSVDGVIYNSDMTTLVIYPIGKTSASFTVPEGVKTINNASFSECQYLKTVVMASTVENVADHAFRRCKNLTTVTLSKSLTRLGVGSFYECTSLKTVNYPDTKEKWEDEEQMELANTWDRGAGSYTVNYNYKG